MPKLKFFPHCTEYPPQYWCYPPLYWCYPFGCTDVIPSHVLMLSPPMYWIPFTVLKLSFTVLMLSPTVLNNLHSTESISYSTEAIPHMYCCYPPQYWRYPSAVLMLSPTVLMLFPRMYWWYPPTVLSNLHSTEAIPHSTEAIPPLYWEQSPQYWSYPPTVLKLSPHSTDVIPRCTEQPPQYWTDVIWGAYFSDLVCTTNVAKVTSFYFFLKLGRSCVLILRLSADSIFALHKTNRTEKTNIQEGAVNRWSNEFCSNKTQILELVDIPGRMKP